MKDRTEFSPGDLVKRENGFYAQFNSQLKLTPGNRLPVGNRFAGEVNVGTLDIDMIGVIIANDSNNDDVLLLTVTFVGRTLLGWIPKDCLSLITHEQRETP